jgi:hypothetical protein
LIGASAFLLAFGWAGQAHAQLGAGTTWLRTDPQGKGIVLSVEPCCNGGLCLIWQIPPMGGQPATTMTVDSPMTVDSRNEFTKHRRLYIENLQLGTHGTELFNKNVDSWR